MKASRSAFTLCLLAVFVVMSSARITAAELDRKFVISTNPILDMFTWYNAELEIAMGSNGTIGVSGTYLNFGDADDNDEETYMNATFFYRYYPSSSFEGFYFGGRIGYNQITAQYVDEDTDNVEEESGDFLAAGIDVGYSWLLGDTKKFYVSLGIGAVRLFGGDLENVDVSFTLPTIRLINVGIAF
jgi:hypothetical protein